MMDAIALRSVIAKSGGANVENSPINGNKCPADMDEFPSEEWLPEEAPAIVLICVSRWTKDTGLLATLLAGTSDWDRQSGTPAIPTPRRTRQRAPSS